MKKKNVVLITLLIVFILACAGFVAYRFMQDENKLTVTEKKYISENKSNIISINVLNDANVFGSVGEGIYYDFLKDFEKEYELSFDRVTISSNQDVSGLSLIKGKTLPDNAKLFYTDHYVLISKKHSVIAAPDKISGTIGFLSKDDAYISKYINSYSLTTKNYDTSDELLKALDDEEIDFVLVPMLEYLDYTLDNLYSIVYHFSDIKEYYYMIGGQDDIINSILSKYKNIWTKDNFDKSFNENELALFVDKLKITEKEMDVLESKEYTYGFVSNAPYDEITGGTYGGIANAYIDAFSSFSGLTFKYKEYRNLASLESALNKKNVDLFVNYYNMASDFVSLDSNYTMNISIVLNNSDENVYHSLAALSGSTVYAKSNSLVGKYLEDNGIAVKYYKTDKEAYKLLKKNNILAMDEMNYSLYKEEYKGSSERFTIDTSVTYNFATNADTMFNRLFTYYASTIDKNSSMYTGLADYESAAKSGTIIYKITKYAFIIVAVALIAVYASYKFGKRVHIKKKIKKADKMKYIDMLTSLKNRNFLSENIPIWNQNTIYPQAIIVIDLNGVQELNDSYGYAEGDKQIQAAANALIKLQLDNTEVMRTDGNEFTVYMIGYSEKQVLSYIKKLNKEFKNLPHDRGAAIGFSIIDDDLKLIEDAINEATEKMKENKELMTGESDEKKI